MELRTPRLLLRPPRSSDLEPLLRILSTEQVARYWPGYDAERIRRELLAPAEGLCVRVLEHQGTVVGAIQHEENPDPEYRHAGLDLFLAPEAQGQGLAGEAIRAVVEALAARGCHRFVIDPAAHNERAILAYARVGFRVVGRLRAYERGPDGTFHDGLLMELLAADLRPEPGEVRRALPADASAVAGLSNALDRYVGRPGTAHTPRSALLAIATQTVHVAVRDERVVGHALSHPAYDTDVARPGWWLEDLFVEEACRGQGLGLALLRRVARDALAEGAASLRWSVRGGNVAARAFYARLGAADEDDRVLALAGDALRALAQS